MLSKDHARAREEAAVHPALKDPETGLANRLHFELVYNYLCAAGYRGMAFTVMLVSCGPNALDEDGVKTVGTAVERTTRASDLVSHIGGGRFVVILLGTNLQGARIAADRVELALESVRSATVSFGLAAYGPHMKKSIELLEAAESALLAAEASGGGVELG
jgi:diguanylate cyclase (GGDEF)-like protein